MTISNVLDQYVEAWNAQDTVKLMSFFADDIVYEDIALKKIMDYTSLREFIQNAFDNYESLVFERISACLANDSISWEWRMIGKKITGELVDVPGMSMTEFKNNKIIRNRDYWSTVPTPN